MPFIKGYKPTEEHKKATSLSNSKTYSSEKVRQKMRKIAIENNYNPPSREFKERNNET